MELEEILGVSGMRDITPRTLIFNVLRLQIELFLEAVKADADVSHVAMRINLERGVTCGDGGDDFGTAKPAQAPSGGPAGLSRFRENFFVDFPV